MSTVTVAKKDFKAARRSKLLWAAAVLLGLIAAFVGYVSGDASGTDAEQVRSLFRALTLILGILLPIVALVASYLAIAGEREGGGIKFLLSLPNTRRDVFVGKLLSRNGIVAGGVGFMYVAAVSTAGVVFGTLLVTLVYGSTFVSVALAMSSAAASRSRAIAGAFGTYFVLVILYVFPVVQVSRIARWVHTTVLGADPNPDLYNAVQYTSPYLGYRKAVNLVLPADMRQVVFVSSIPDEVSYGSAEANEALPLYLQDEFSVVVLAVWLVGPLLIGYLLFRRADLE
ncbi:ABC-2 type transporter [Halobacteriales archaeon QH_8_67_27]|nr:MAG: ABC-2 type transporter [Halobacteriales archaeon QH_8_67_27]